ncbi:hypothetical protein KUTeg_019172 [Tegillarca granosa]|uniref:Complex 1 LYR protein domain-containing protein n=1 Tax=Tegillarca granosa TaxID=220873 RepID=A0ABQ9EEC6_TEGGR|nr:hypothetical protein KUTeg_019172 [Tegillarca granosa]
MILHLTRMYAIRKTRDEFRSNQKVSDPSVIEQLIKKAEDNLELIKRQVLIGHILNFNDGL